MIFIGADVGTSGVRAVAADEQGRILASSKHDFPVEYATPDPSGRFEQDPSVWRKALIECLSVWTPRMRESLMQPDAVTALAVSSTSGTLVAIDETGEPVGPAIMYNDPRASEEADICNEVGADLVRKLGYRFNSSFALPKILYALRKQSGIYGKAAWFGNPTDYLNTVLCGRRAPTDQTNALKMGYDLIENRWPGFINEKLGIGVERLPETVISGEPIGVLCDDIAAQTGLPRRTTIVAGMTDGCASQVAAGALAPGQWCSTLGTTLVIKGVTRNILRDPEGAIYCHRHPMGFWLPGGASNVGADFVAKRFRSEDLDALGREALRISPSRLTVYPLERRGERYPFHCDDAEGFVIGEASCRAELFTAYLEGVAHAERLAYSRLSALGAEVGGEVSVVGGGTGNDAWLQIRADILNMVLLRPESAFAAMGAAVLAASKTAFGNIIEAACAMVRIERRVEPRSEFRAAYDAQHERFLEALRARGYIR